MKSSWPGTRFSLKFAALTGYNAAIAEAARLTDKRVELDEYQKVDLDEKLRIIQDQLDKQPKVTITYFQADKRKSGGAYITVTGNLKKIDRYKRMVVMRDETWIPIDDIFEIGIELWKSIQADSVHVSATLS